MIITQLRQVALSLEAAAGITTETNPNEAGYWKRIALAAEELAGASTAANETEPGYQLRTAIALEAIAGTSGAEENLGEGGYLKRIVDALEVQAGAVTTTSVASRIVTAAANATFGDSFDPDFEYISGAPSATVNCSWNAGTEAIEFTGAGFGEDRAAWDAAGVLEPGTYRFTATDTMGSFAQLRVRVGSVVYDSGGGVAVGEPVAGSWGFDIVVAAVAGQKIFVIDIGAAAPTVTNPSLKRIA